MNRLTRHALSFLAASLVAIPAAALADGPDLFKTHKCNSCHSVKVASIALAPGADADKDAPDLSKTGSKYDKKAIAMWLLKKSDHKGVKHKKLFEGSTEDLKAISSWLEGLK